jgi:hypothetical protein
MRPAVRFPLKFPILGEYDPVNRYQNIKNCLCCMTNFAGRYIQGPDALFESVSEMKRFRPEHISNIPVTAEAVIAAIKAANTCGRCRRT